MEFCFFLVSFIHFCTENTSIVDYLSLLFCMPVANMCTVFHSDDVNDQVDVRRNVLAVNRNKKNSVSFTICFSFA